MTIAADSLISVQPEDLKFKFEVEKQSYCDLKVTNNTKHHVAFKVKTTSPKKYFVRPNTGVMNPGDSCLIRGNVRIDMSHTSYEHLQFYIEQHRCIIHIVTLQAQWEYPPNMQCRDKFLVQSTVVPPSTNVDELPQDTFNKEVGDSLQECKLRVIYTRHKDFGDGRNQDSHVNGGLQRVKDERDAAVRQLQELQQSLEIYKRRRDRRKNNGLSLKFALLVGLIGLAMGLLLQLFLSDSP